ncbi:growth arrest-specific protein 1 [Anolis sagrei]|uniref:growth arrest-specific protein 1 n=1 Tax=Anolis sagrei TaxID=38937 RepID=UPI00352095B6
MVARGRRLLLPLFPLLLPLLLLGCVASSQGRRLICWQAMLQCQEEPDCSYAFSQYAEACAPVLMAAGGGGGGGGMGGEAASSNNNNNHRRRCPSHCISALIQLNHTRRGPALEDCDCDQDENCRATKRAIEPCLPRMGGHGNGGGSDSGGNGGGGGTMGCTEARRRCDWDGRCSLALGRYMAHCGKLFNGLRCTEECRAVIQDMLAVPKALLLNDCVCDGLERPICESIKENMARLCFSVGHGSSGASSDGGAGALDEDYYDEYEEDLAAHSPPRSEDGEGALAPPPRKHEEDPGHGAGRALGPPWTLLLALPAWAWLLLAS